MNAYFNNLLNQARSSYGEDAVAAEDDQELFTLTLDDNKLMVIGEDESNILLRTDCGAIDDLENPAALFEELLNGNFFWQGTDGAVLSVGKEEDIERVWLTQRLPGEALDDDEALRRTCEEFITTAHLWRTRIDLYRPQPPQPAGNQQEEA